MKNHQCVFSNSCAYYRDDDCQGCNYAAKTKSTSLMAARTLFDDAVKKMEEDIMKRCTYYETSAKAIDKSEPGWSIKNVIFNNPCTIVLWRDGTKTVVKCENEAFDPEKGLAMALAKKMLGNKGNYFNVFKKWLPEDYETPKAPVEDPRPWKIWYRHYENGKLIGSGVYIKCYQCKSSATRVAKKVYGDKEKYKFVVSTTNPWVKEG